MNQLPTAKRVAIVSALVEGNSIRSTARMTGISKTTILKLLEDLGPECAAFHNEHVRNIRAQRIQCDEIWTFCFKKQRRVRKDDPAEFGDQWVFVAMDAEAKLIPSFTIGKRNAATTKDFVCDLMLRIDNRPQITTDGFRFYTTEIPRFFGPNVDFAQLIKL
jgi:IS1 family transposase